MAKSSDPALTELKQRLESFDRNCLTGLQQGMHAMAAGDLTVSVTPVTTPIATASRNADVQSLIVTFNSMLGRAQSALEGYEKVREELRRALGDHSCLQDLEARLTSLDANCLTSLGAGLEAMTNGRRDGVG